MGHMLETFIFSSRKRSNRQKWIWFGILAGAIFLCFWWFKAVAMGIDGPINEHKGLGWRKVRNLFSSSNIVADRRCAQFSAIQTVMECKLRRGPVHP